MKSCLDGAPDERGRCPAAEPVALMRPLVVVVAHELGERPLQRRPAGEISAVGRRRASALAGSCPAAARRSRWSRHGVAWFGCGAGPAADRPHRRLRGTRGPRRQQGLRSEEHTSELQSLAYLVCRLLLEKKKK